MPAVDFGGNKPSGKYAERLLAGAWYESDPQAMFDAQAHWRAMRDQAHDQHQALRGNSAQLRHLLDSNGFDALHEERALVTRNFELLAELRDSAQKLYGHAGNLGQNLRSSMARTVEIVEKELEQIDNLPLITPESKESTKDAIIAQVNGELIAESQAAATELAGRVAAHQALASSLPWFTSTANSSPFAPPPTSSSGAQMMSTTFKQGPTPGNNGASGPGTGGAHSNSQAPEGTQGEGSTGQQPGNPGQQSQKQGTGGQHSEGGPKSGTDASKGTDGKTSGGQAPSASPVSPASDPTGGLHSAGQSPPLTMPHLGGGSGGASGLGSGGGMGGGLGGGLPRGGFPQGLPQGVLNGNPLSSLTGSTSPASAANSLSSAASGGGVPKVPPLHPAGPVGVPASAAAAPAVPPPAAAHPAAPSAAPGSGAVVQPAGMSSAPPPQSAAPVASPIGGTLGPAPPLAGPAPGPGAVVPPATAVAPPAAAPPGPLHAPLPPVGTPLVRAGIVERADDPDIVRARQLIWELMWAGRRYPSLDWAVGLHRPSGGGQTTFYLTSSEGECYIPQHVFLPADPVLVPLFHDTQFVHVGWRQYWQGWTDPGRIVFEHHRMRQDSLGVSMLYAIVSSRDLSALKHMISGSVRLEVAAASDNPFVDPEKAKDVPTVIPAGRAHRLAITSPGLYGLVQRLPENQRWSAGIDLAADAAAATDERHVRTGLVAADVAPPRLEDPQSAVLHGVIDQLRVPQGALEDWGELQMAYLTHVMQSQGLRHTPQDYTDDTGYVDEYRRARAYEVAWLLNAPPGPLPVDWLADVAYAHLCATDSPDRTRALISERIV